MKKVFKTMAFTLLGLVLSVNVWGAGTTVTYKQTSTSAASVSSGTAPKGSSITFKNTYNTKEQLTKDNSMTYTLKGYAGYKITKLTMSMHSNKSAGTGKFSLVAGTTTLAEIASNTGFNQSAWYGSWTQSYVTVTPTMTKTDYTIKTGEDVVLTISASANSLFCESITITYEESAAPKTDVNVSAGANGSIKAYSDANYSSEIAISNNKISVDQNSTVYFKATPNTGYVVDSWTGATANPSDNTKASLEVGTTAATVSVSFKAPASHDITWYANGQQVDQYNQQEGAALTIPSDPNPDTYCYGKTFVGWTANQTYSHETAAPGDLFTSKDSKTVGSTTAYYAVFADVEEGEAIETKSQTLQYDTWSYSGSTTDKSTYRLFHSGSYIESAAFDLSKLSKVIVYGGTFGGDSYSSLTIGDGTNTWKSVTVSGSSQTGTNTYTDGTSLSGTGKLRVTSNSGSATGTGVRISKVEIFVNQPTFDISNYTTTCAAVYEATVADGILNGLVLISKTDNAAAGAASLTGLHEGDKVYIFPTANTGYKLDAVTVNSNPVTDTEGKYIYTIGTEGITVSATFKAATYQITYNLDDGAWVDESQVAKTYTYGTGATLPTADDVMKADNTFLGWFLNNTGEEATSEIGATETGDKSFTARWLASGSKNVTINGDGKLTYSTFKPTTVNKDAENLEIEYSIEKGFTIVTVTVKVGETELTETEIEFSDSKLTITPTAGFTDDVVIQFMVANKMFTVTWMANKTQFKQEEIQEGNTVTLPATNPVDVISGEDTYKFQGWFTEEQYSNETTAPAYITNNTIEPTGDVTYYAVYAMKESQASSTTFVKGALSDLTTGQKVVIVEYTDKMALTSTATDDTYNLKNKSVSPTNNKITSVTDDIKWTVTKNNSTYQFKQGDKYLYGYSDGSHYNLKFGSTSDNWTIASGGTGYTLESGLCSGYKLEYFSSKFTIYKKDALDKAFYMDFYIPEVTETTKNYRTRVAVIDHIAVHGTPVTTNFVAGETFNATGLSIDVYYKDEDTPTNVTEGFTFAPTGALKTTDENITFTYQGKTVDLTISVSNTVSKIEVTTNPTKMEYNEGEQFNPEGMEVTATYDNDAQRVVTGYDYEPKGDLALGDKITISFGGQNKELTITINPVQKTTVNWFVNGDPYTAGEPSTAVIPGKKVTILPTEPEACTGNQFMGWTTDDDYYNATTAPTDLFKTLDKAPTIGETETNFYAVFASEAVGTYDEKVTLTSLTAPTADKFTYAFAKSSGSTSPSWNADQAKTYVKNTLTVTSKNSRVITKIEYTYNINKNDKGIAPTGATVTGNNSDNGSWDATNKTWTSSTNAATTVTLTVNGSAGNYGFTAIKVYLTGGTVLSDYSTTCLAALANPTITTAEGEYCGSVDVVITQPAGNPEGAKIMYSTDNGTWQEYTAAVNITTSGTVYAKVVKDPKSTEVVSATYTVYPAYTLAEAATAASATSQIACLTFTDLLVQARTQSEAFLKASDGQIVLLSKFNHELSVGDKLVADNAHLNFIKSHDLLQLTSIEGIEKNGTGTPVADEKTITEITSANYGQLVKIMNVTYDATNKKFTDASSNEIAIDAKFFVGGNLPSSWPDGGKFNATGVVVLDNNSNAVIAPRNTEDLESLATPLDAPTDFVVTSVNSYRASYSWTAVENNVGYTLYIYDGDEQIYKSNTIAKTATEYAPQKDLVAGHPYTAKLVALGDKAEHSDSHAAEVSFTTNPNAKLNWYVGGSFYQSTDASQEKVVTPDDPTSPCPTNYENFVTWYTEEIVSETGQITALDAAKKVKAGDAAASQAGSAKGYNFYAVFGKIKTAGTDKYVAVTEAQDNWKGEYLIGYDEGDDKDALTVFNGSLTTLDAANDYKTISLEEDGSIAAAANEGYQFNIEKSTTEGYYTIQSASGIYIANTTNGNKLSESSTTAYKNTISWSERIDIATGENTTASHLSFNSDQNQMRFRYYTSNKNNIILYKREKTNPQYSGYITTCPQTYTITIAENAKGTVTAATMTEILKGAKVLLTAEAAAGYTRTGGAWVVKKTATSEVVENLIGNTNYLTMPDYDVTIDYDFQEIKDNFVDNLHGNTAIEKGGANYELPSLTDFEGETGKPSDNFKKFIGWSATSYDSGEPATEKPAILEGNQTATGATYVAVWYNGSGKYITEYCQTAVPTNLHLVAEYHKATSVRIDWNNVTGADMYHIIVMDGGANFIADADVTESVYDLSGLTPGATYICTVKAHKDCWSDETEEFEFTTKENIQSYAVTINAEGGTYTIDPELEDGKIQEGATVTITNIAPTDADHYFFKELTVPEATDLTEITGGYKFTMPGKAVTINIVFAEYPKVTWKMEGAADVVTTAVLYEDKFEVGTVKEAPADWKYKTYFPEFAGWVTSDKCDADGNVTTAEFITATTEVPATGLTVYGAVAKSASADLTQTTKVVADANIETDAIYVIGAAQSSTVETMYYLYSVDGEKNWGRMATADDETNSPMLLTAEVVTGGFALKNAAGLYIQGTTVKSKFPAMTETAATLTLSTTAADESAIHHIYSTSTFYMRHNYSSGTTQGIRWYDGTSTGTPAYLYKVGLTYEKLTTDPQPDYARTDLVVGNYGTVCVPYTVKTTDRSGATFWNIETSNAPLYTNPTSITIVQEEGDLEAGKPYIFCATETEMAMFFSEDIYDGSTFGAADYPYYNGLYGNLTNVVYTINETGYTPGYFFVLQQKLYECGVNCTVGPNRGWVQADQIGSEPVEAPVSAPRRVIGNPNGTPTGINNLNVDGWVDLQGAHKYFQNNHIVIVNEGRIYNAQGIRIQ